MTRRIRNKLWKLTLHLVYERGSNYLDNIVMTRMKSLCQKITLLVMLALVFISLIGYSSLVLTQIDLSPPDSHPSRDQQGAGGSYALPPVPADAPSGDQQGAGSYGPCQADEELPPLTAIVPKWKDPVTRKTYVLGRTTFAHPTFWFYIPYQPGAHAEFVLQNEDQYQIYKTSFELVETPGVVSFNLPSTSAATLVAGKSYFWYFKIKCDPQGSTDDFVTGWVQRVEPSPELDENDIWHDALTNLDTVTADLLQRAGLSNLKPQPIVQQHTPSQ